MLLGLAMEASFIKIIEARNDCMRFLFSLDCPRVHVCIMNFISVIRANRRSSFFIGKSKLQPSTFARARATVQTENKSFQRFPRARAEFIFVLPILPLFSRNYGTGGVILVDRLSHRHTHTPRERARLAKFS